MEQDNVLDKIDDLIDKLISLNGPLLYSLEFPN